LVRGQVKSKEGFKPQKSGEEFKRKLKHPGPFWDKGPDEAKDWKERKRGEGVRGCKIKSIQKGTGRREDVGRPGK